MNAVCEVCGAIGYEHLLLCCRDCKGSHAHQYCLAKVLFDPSLEDWFCTECKQRHNEGSHSSSSLEKVSSEQPSNHALFDSTSQQPITKRLESTTVVGTWGQPKGKSTVVGANLKKKHSSRAKSLRKKCIRNKSNMRGKDINRRGIRSKRSSNFTEQLNLSIRQFGSDSSSKGVKQPTEVEISDNVQNLRKDSPKKRRCLILTGDDEDEEAKEKAEDVQQENLNHQPLKCNESMVKHRDLLPTGRKALAPIRCQDLHSACSLKADTGALAVSLPSHVQSKVITHNQPGPEHDPATFFSPLLDQITDTARAVTIRIVENFQKMLPILEKDQVATTEKAAQNDALKAKNDAPQCQALQSQFEEIPGLRSQVKALGDVGTALRGEKAELEAELKLGRSKLEQIEVKSLRERIQTLEEKEVAWLGLEERHKAAITAFKVEQDKMIQDKSAQDSQIKTFHGELNQVKRQVESYKSQLKDAKLEKKAVVHNEGSYRSLGKVSSERPSKQAKGGSVMRFNARDIMRVVPLLSEDAVLRITRLGFGNFLEISFLDLICRDMIRWLATKYVVREHEGKECIVLNVDPTSPRFITPEVVNVIYGAPLGPDLNLRPLPRNKVHDDTLRICLGVEKKEDIIPYHLALAINYAKEIGDDEFEAKCFFILLFNRMLLPSTSHYIVPKDMQLVQDIERIGQINWCQEILENVKSGLVKFHKLKGGSILNPALMLIFFMDNVDCEDIMVGDEFKVPRIKYYTQEMVKKFSKLDYENLKLKPWKNTVYSQYMHVEANGCEDQCKASEINVGHKRSKNNKGDRTVKAKKSRNL